MSPSGSPFLANRVNQGPAMFVLRKKLEAAASLHFIDMPRDVPGKLMTTSKRKVSPTSTRLERCQRRKRSEARFVRRLRRRTQMESAFMILHNLRASAKSADKLRKPSYPYSFSTSSVPTL